MRKKQKDDEEKKENPPIINEIKCFAEAQDVPSPPTLQMAQCFVLMENQWVPCLCPASQIYFYY
jgi:hypothetical protein